MTKAKLEEANRIETEIDSYAEIVANMEDIVTHDTLSAIITTVNGRVLSFRYTEAGNGVLKTLAEKELIRVKKIHQELIEKFEKL
jgi:hypothetical protein